MKSDYVVNDVVTVVSSIGEIVGRLLDTTDETITLGNPRMVGPTQNNQMGFFPGVSGTGVHEPESVKFNKATILCIVPTASDVERVWTETTSGLIL